jgi:NTP pyrophosphatase (non-canonical NTP hydrolase)
MSDPSRSELADVVLSVMAIAHTEGVDLDAALADKWARVQAKYAAHPGTGER